jgi:hypothetical protein
MKNVWRDFWTSEPSDMERELREAGFTTEQATQLVDLKLHYEYGYFHDDGGPAPRNAANGSGQRP